MDFQVIISFLAPLGLIVAGIIMKISNNNEKFGSVKKYWLVFILLGFFSLLFKIYKYL